MKRTYKKRALFDSKKLGQLVFGLFIVFIAYKILTPPSDETARIASPDGSKTARLRTFFYYDNQPSYKIYYRETGKRAWLNLLYLPAYTNTPPEATEAGIEWSADSEQLFFTINGSSIWHHAFE
ncbi:hypothetical protein [Pontiella sulfatireligans]|uniref:Dipeptidylpeptidase IV N-terminal domain-containing protein n=1 Tax=Pontiella sulfatireligans TaxID=2750658 RepID=A0A6C2UR39_9BACT|nr:hypothetical protein [Pontiella sulfatireligans]VGO22765.1 hypothetical protein SCARR_04861 [Pontiella sulfatireligans]